MRERGREGRGTALLRWWCSIITRCPPKWEELLHGKSGWNIVTYGVRNCVEEGGSSFDKGVFQPYPCLPGHGLSDNYKRNIIHYAFYTVVHGIELLTDVKMGCNTGNGC